MMTVSHTIIARNRETLEPPELYNQPTYIILDRTTTMAARRQAVVSVNSIEETSFGFQDNPWDETISLDELRYAIDSADSDDNWLNASANELDDNFFTCEEDHEKIERALPATPAHPIPATLMHTEYDVASPSSTNSALVRNDHRPLYQEPWPIFVRQQNINATPHHAGININAQGSGTFFPGRYEYDNLLFLTSPQADTIITITSETTEKYSHRLLAELLPTTRYNIVLEKQLRELTMRLIHEVITVQKTFNHRNISEILSTLKKFLKEQSSYIQYTFDEINITSLAYLIFYDEFQTIRSTHSNKITTTSSYELPAPRSQAIYGEMIKRSQRHMVIRNKKTGHFSIEEESSDAGEISHRTILQNATATRADRVLTILRDPFAPIKSNLQRDLTLWQTDKNHHTLLKALSNCSDQLEKAFLSCNPFRDACELAVEALHATHLIAHYQHNYLSDVLTDSEYAALLKILQIFDEDSRYLRPATDEPITDHAIATQRTAMMSAIIKEYINTAQKAHRENREYQFFLLSPQNDSYSTAALESDIRFKKAKMNTPERRLSKYTLNNCYHLVIKFKNQESIIKKHFSFLITTDNSVKLVENALNAEPSVYSYFTFDHATEIGTPTAEECFGNPAFKTAHFYDPDMARLTSEEDLHDSCFFKSLNPCVLTISQTVTFHSIPTKPGSTLTERIAQTATAGKLSREYNIEPYSTWDRLILWGKNHPKTAALVGTVGILAIGGIIAAAIKTNTNSNPNNSARESKLAAANAKNSTATIQSTLTQTKAASAIATPAAPSQAPIALFSSSSASNLKATQVMTTTMLPKP